MRWLTEKSYGFRERRRGEIRQAATIGMVIVLALFGGWALATSSALGFALLPVVLAALALALPREDGSRD